MMIHNETHNVLLNAADQTGWNEDTQIMFLTQFIENEKLTDRFEEYITEQVEEEL